jgi:hypothetical protein
VFGSLAHVSNDKSAVVIISGCVMCLDNVCTLNLFGYPDWGVFRAFPSVVRQMPGYNSQRLGTANTLPNLLFVLFFYYSCCFVVHCDVYVLFMCKYILPPGVNPTAVDKYINVVVDQCDFCKSHGVNNRDIRKAIVIQGHRKRWTAFETAIT